MKLCSFDNMSNLEMNKKGEVKGYFQFKLLFRKGVVGNSATYLTGDMVQRLNAITDEKFRGCNLALHV